MRIFATLILALSLLGGTAWAQSDIVLGTFRDWSAVTYAEAGQTVCYAVSVPTSEEGDYTQRGKVYLQVTRRAGDAVGVVSFQAGYRFAEGATVTVAIGSPATFTLFTHQQAAWAYSTADDSALVAAMRAGATMVVRGASARGTATTDTYSLYGVSAALDAIAEACP